MTCSPSHLLKGWKKKEKGFGIICSKSASVSAIWRLCLSIIHQCVKRRAREQLSIEGQPIGLIQVKSDVWLPEQAYHSQAARWLWPGDTTSTLDLHFFTQGVSPQCKYLGLACFPCVCTHQGDFPGLAPYSSKIIKKREEATGRHSVPCSAAAVSSSSASANGKQIDWETITTLRRSTGEQGMSWSWENDLCSNLLRSGHMGLRGCYAACLYTFCWETDIQSGKASMNKTS